MNRLGRSGLQVSRFGFGGYRVDDDTPAHAAALNLALDRGCNLIDTSTNYTDGGSERMVGAVLGERTSDGRLQRDQVVVVSKVGYLQGHNLRLAREREDTDRGFPEMVKYADGLWHCLHPEFIADQLGRSLERLGLERLDVCLLHNPEYFLSWAAKQEQELEAAREEFYRRLEQAFGQLEQEADAGRISWYGVSSNSVAGWPGDPDTTSLDRMLAAARAAGGEQHRFAVLQLPLNLFESAPVLERKHDAGSVLDLAVAEDVGVLVNRPLNAIVDKQLMRLADPKQQDDPGVPFEAVQAAVAELEEEWATQMAPHVKVRAGALPPDRFFRWAGELANLRQHLRGIEHWQQVRYQMVEPAVAAVILSLGGAFSGDTAGEWERWKERYLRAFGAMLAAVAREVVDRSVERARAIATLVDPHLPAGRRGESLSRKALWIVGSTPGVSCVLLGMRRDEYVEDAMAVAAWPALESPHSVYEALQKAAELAV